MAIKYYKMLDLMNRQGIGKEELRKKISISPATMAKISKNQYVSLEVIDKICDVLSCQPGDLMEHFSFLVCHHQHRETVPRWTPTRAFRLILRTLTAQPLL